MVWALGAGDRPGDPIHSASRSSRVRKPLLPRGVAETARPNAHTSGQVTTRRTVDNRPADAAPALLRFAGLLLLAVQMGHLFGAVACACDGTLMRESFEGSDVVG